MSVVEFSNLSSTKDYKPVFVETDNSINYEEQLDDYLRILGNKADSKLIHRFFKRLLERLQIKIRFFIEKEVKPAYICKLINPELKRIDEKLEKYEENLNLTSVKKTISEFRFSMLIPLQTV